MPYSYEPTLNEIQNPSHFSPVYAPNWFAFRADFTASTATNAVLYADINILQQGIENATILESAGRFKVPMRANNTFVLNSSTPLKSYVSYPYNNGGKKYYAATGFTAAGPAAYVNECVGFATTGIYPYFAGDFPTISPEQDGAVKYQLSYGLEYNPNFTFNTLLYNAGLTTSGTYSFYWNVGGGVNHFASVGDLVNINIFSGLYTYWNGTATILSIIDDGFSTLITTDQPIGPDQVDQIIAAGGAISGEFTLVQHHYGTSSNFWAYNGTRQYDEMSVNFDNIYYLRPHGTTSSLFPSSSTQSNFQFMNDYGKDSKHAIPIMPGQSERGRFLTDFYDVYGSTGLILNITTYNSNMVAVATQSLPLDVSPGAIYLPYKCWTVQLFDKLSSIVDGNYYKFTLQTYNLSSVLVNLASIWYVGYNPCSRYTNYRIKFLNRQGTWCYWNFNKDSKKTSNINRVEYQQPIQYDQTFFTIPAGGIVNVDSPFSLSKLRGQNILSTSVNETFSLNSDFITEDACRYLEQLFISPQVFIFYDTYTLADNTQLTAVNIPIIVSDPSYTPKTINRDRLFNLTLNYKYAFDTNIQNP